MIHILVPTITNRLTYTFNFIFEELSGLSYKFHINFGDFTNAEGPKLIYGTDLQKGIPSVFNAQLLFETEIKNFQAEVGHHQEVPVLFEADEADNFLLPFDVFSAVFYMISRYEEYHHKSSDLLGRFKAEDSLAFKMGFLNKAVVNHWQAFLIQALLGIYPAMTVKLPTFCFQPTLDIDNAFAYKGKGFIRALGGTFKDLFAGRLEEVGERCNVLLNGIQDPYDSFEFVKEIHQLHKLQPIVFWLLGDRAQYDKNLSYNNSQLQELIKETAEYALNGIHPSVAASLSGNLIKEKKRLERINNSAVELSRMHYLRFTMPETFRQLIDADIHSDYSMGFSEHSGFRAGVAHPFPFFDLDQNRQTNLTIYPFQIMDATYMYHQNKGVEDILSEMKAIVEEVKSVNGQLITVFHNESLGQKKEWEGWKLIYTELLNYILS